MWVYNVCNAQNVLAIVLVGIYDFIGPNHYHMSPVVLSDYFIMPITYIYMVDHDIHNYGSYVHLHVVMKSFFRF